MCAHSVRSGQAVQPVVVVCWEVPAVLLSEVVLCEFDAHVGSDWH